MLRFIVFLVFSVSIIGLFGCIPPGSSAHPSRLMDQPQDSTATENEDNKWWFQYDPQSDLTTHPLLSIHWIDTLGNKDYQGINMPFYPSKDTAIRYGIFGSNPHLAQAPYGIVFLLGRGEWIEKYIAIYEQLHQALQTPIVIIDHQGQGGSGGIRGHIETYKTYVDHVRLLLLSTMPHKPYAIVAHSMGGMIGLYGTLTGQLSPNQMVLSAPLISLRETSIPTFVAKPLSSMLSTLGRSQMRTHVSSETDFSFEKNRLTGDRENFEFYKRTPFPIPSASMGWVHATFQASEHIFRPEPISQYLPPISIMLGSDEQVVSAEGTKKWVEIAKKNSRFQVNLQYYEGAKHELLFERAHITDQATAHITDFLKPNLLP